MEFLSSAVSWSVICNCGISYLLFFYFSCVSFTWNVRASSRKVKLQNLKTLSAPIKVLSDRLRVRLFCYANLQG